MVSKEHKTIQFVSNKPTLSKMSQRIKGAQEHGVKYAKIITDKYFQQFWTTGPNFNIITDGSFILETNIHEDLRQTDQWKELSYIYRQYKINYIKWTITPSTTSDSYGTDQTHIYIHSVIIHKTKFQDDLKQNAMQTDYICEGKEYKKHSYLIYEATNSPYTFKTLHDIKSNKTHVRHISAKDSDKRTWSLRSDHTKDDNVFNPTMVAWITRLNNGLDYRDVHLQTEYSVSFRQILPESDFRDELSKYRIKDIPQIICISSFGTDVYASEAYLDTTVAGALQRQAQDPVLGNKKWCLLPQMWERVWACDLHANAPKYGRHQSYWTITYNQGVKPCEMDSILTTVEDPQHEMMTHQSSTQFAAALYESALTLKNENWFTAQALKVQFWHTWYRNSGISTLFPIHATFKLTDILYWPSDELTDKFSLWIGLRKKWAAGVTSDRWLELALNNHVQIREWIVIGEITNATELNTIIGQINSEPPE